MTSPAGFSLREWWAILRRSASEFLADDAMGLAQQVAFSSILAFFPAAIFLVGVFGLFGIFEPLRGFLAPVAPDSVMDIVEQIDRDADPASSAVAFALGAAGALWAASGAMNAVMKAVNLAYDRTETRPFWKTRLIAALLVVAIGVTTAGLLLLVVFGEPLGAAIADWARLGGAFDLFWTIARWPTAFAAVLLFFALVYYAAPNLDARNWKWITPGSVVGAVSWLALSGLFALYTSFSDSYSRTYGSLAGGIVLLLWLNYSAYAILFGAELNAESERQAEIRASGGARAGLVKPSRRP